MHFDLIYAESDGIPGLIVDRYGDVLVLQSLTAGSEFWKETLADLFSKKPDSQPSTNAPMPMSVNWKDCDTQRLDLIYVGDLTNLESRIRISYFGTQFAIQCQPAKRT